MTAPSTPQQAAPALEKLHDFYQPPPPSWTPQTIDWYVVFAALFFLLVYLAIRAIRRWYHDRYRRQALKELSNTPLNQLSALLKRTALTAWPREHVAALSGKTWLLFLTETSSLQQFQETPGNRIEEIAFAPAGFSSEDEQRLRDLAGQWIRRHRVQA